MNEQIFWQHLATYGGLQHGWWYNIMSVPSLIMSTFALIMTSLAARQIERKLSIFMLLVFACVPLVLVIPSWYAAFRPRDSLALVGTTWPAAVNSIPRQTAQTLSMYLDFLAQLGITGIVLATLTGFGSMIFVASMSNIPVISTTARNITQFVREATQRLAGNRTGVTPMRHIASADAPYGYFKILTGSQDKNTIVVRPGDTIGRKNSTIIISNPSVSRTHARIDVDEHNQTTIADQGSSNGLFVIRTDDQGLKQRHDVGALNGSPFVLCSNDIVTLGDTEMEKEATIVELLFKRDSS